MMGGKLYRKNLQKAKLDLSEFMLLCRECRCFDLEEIKTAIFEHNEKLSILPKAACRPASCEDLKNAKQVFVAIYQKIDDNLTVYPIE